MAAAEPDGGAPQAGRQAQVLEFLRSQLGQRAWQLARPSHGTGHESYFAHAEGLDYFIKLGAQPARYQALAELGWSPPLITAGQLADGASILVQRRVAGHMPSRADFQQHWRTFARCLGEVHRCLPLQRLLPAPAARSYAAATLARLGQVVERWEGCKAQVPACAGFVDAQLQQLAKQAEDVTGGGLAAVHNDVCNANWLVAATGQVYLLDYEALALDDPAQDLGTLLWWYYPPPMRRPFIAAAGYTDDPGLRQRMQLRMALHALFILLPRPGSFDRFDPGRFAAALEDFRAAVSGQENPQGNWV